MSFSRSLRGRGIFLILVLICRGTRYQTKTHQTTTPNATVSRSLGPATLSSSLYLLYQKSPAPPPLESSVDEWMSAQSEHKDTVSTRFFPVFPLSQVASTMFAIFAPDKAEQSRFGLLSCACDSEFRL